MANDNSTQQSDSSFEPEEPYYSLKDTAESNGYEGALALCRRAGFHLSSAMYIAEAQACMQGADAISSLLIADLHARIVGDESAGTFETLNDDCALSLTVGLQRLVYHSRESLEQLVAMERRANSKS